MTLTEKIFWASAAFVFYVYFGYPVLLMVLKKIFSHDDHGESEDRLPKVSVIIAAHNEEENIGNTIVNKLSQEYPADLLEVIVVSDGSTDKTESIVEDLCDRHKNVTLIRQLPRQGKTVALNSAVSYASGEILIFSDANSRYSSNAIKKLVNRLSNEDIGYVTGRMIYTDKHGEPCVDGGGLYMRYENFLRGLESSVSSIVGVDGGIDGMKKAIYTPMKADQLPDFVQPLMVVSKGLRVVYEDEASLYEESLTDSKSEFRMRVRVCLRALWALHDTRELMNPFKYGIFSIQLISHKLLRYLLFMPLLAILASSIILAFSSLFFLFVALSQTAFYCVTAISLLLNREIKGLIGFVNYFNILNFACLIAFVKFISGKKIVIWKPRVG